MPASQNGGFRQHHLALLIALASLIGVGIYLSLPAPKSLPLAEARDPRQDLLAEVPEPLKTPFDEGKGRVLIAAQSLPATPEALVDALATAHRSKEGLLPARPIPGEAPEIPRSPEFIADVFTAKERVQVSSFELAGLFGALLKARGFVPEYGLVTNARFGATELIARRFVVRVPGGAWLAPDGGPTDQVIPLDAYALTAYTLGFRALGAIAKRDADTASRASSMARRLMPDDPAFMFVSAESAMLNLMPEEALRTFEAAASLRADAMTWYRLGRHARLDQKPFKADVHFQKAITADPTFALPHIELAELALERIDLTPKDEHEAIKFAARSHLDAATRADPNAPGLRIAQAHLLALSDDETEGQGAIRLLEEEVALHPGREDGWLVLANVYAAEERDADAIAALEKARDQGIVTAAIFEGLGGLYGVTGRFEDGRKAFEKALELAPESDSYRPQLAQFEHQVGHTTRARDLLIEQLSKFPDDSTSGLLLAQLEIEQGDLAKASQAVDGVLKRDPASKEGRVLAHFVAVLAKRATPETRKVALEAAGGPRQLAELLMRNGLIEEAEQVLTDALAVAIAAPPREEDLSIPVLLVAIYTASGRMDEANALREATLTRVDEASRKELEQLFQDAVREALEDSPSP
jgi:tetratricopeptide (TPR) repeat protein